MAKRVVVFYVGNIANGGDELLFRTTEWLVRDVCPACDVYAAQLVPNKADLRRGGYRWRKRFSSALERAAAPFSGTLRHVIHDVALRLRNGGYFGDALEGAGAAIDAVGMLKFASQDHSHVFDQINRICSARGIPVMMSAMSVAAPDASDWRANQLLRAVNSPCVRMVTTRDGEAGLERLRRDWVRRPDVATDFVGDPALWAPECLGIRKDASSRVFGIGVIRGDIFADYDGGASREDLLAAYCGLLRRLDSLGLEWRLFTNGAPCDQNFGEEIIAASGAPASRLLPRPENARRMMEYVASFRAVFAGRLHACITSFALDIPVAGLLWDDKLRFVSDSFGIRRFFSGADELAGETLAQRLLDAAETPLDGARRDLLKTKTRDSLAAFLSGALSGDRE